MLLYISHFLTTWTSRLFEFACYLFIVKTFETSLLLPSIYGFTTTLSAVFFSNYVGNLVDKTARFSFASITLFLQKASIVLSCILFYLMTTTTMAGGGIYIKYSCYLMIVLLGCILKLASIGNTISVEKDWVRVITRGQTETMITIMKRIDLFCKTMAPISIGLLFTLSSPLTPLMMAIWNIVSYLMEYQLLWKVYQDHPDLDDAREHTPLLSTTTNHQQQEQEEGGRLMEEIENVVTWNNYVHHRAFLPSLSMSLLNLTVLSFGGIMVSYLKLIGYDDMPLGILRATAGISGMASTFIFPYLREKIGIIRIGHWALWFEVFCLLPVVVSFKLSASNPYGPIFLFGGMALSRIGLWLYDISETVLLQQLVVEPGMLGGIFGWQHTLCNIFDLTQYILTMIISDPKLFSIPATISFLAILSAALIYTTFVKKERGHVFHYIKIEE